MTQIRVQITVECLVTSTQQHNFNSDIEVTIVEQGVEIRCTPKTSWGWCVRLQTGDIRLVTQKLYFRSLIRFSIFYSHQINFKLSDFFYLLFFYSSAFIFKKINFKLCRKGTFILLDRKIGKTSAYFYFRLLEFRLFHVISITNMKTCNRFAS